jgi:pimeloyl-ACP methyl ester carboxylesterase
MEMGDAGFGPERGTLTSSDGLRLAVECRGRAGAPAIVFAHGFGQTRQAWTRAAETLARRGWRSVTFDARGHGDSDRLPGGDYRLQQFSDDLLAVARAVPGPPVLVGASMGGLLGLVAAGECRPPPFRALVLVDITPRWEPAGVARMLEFMRARPRGFASLDEAADQVAAYLSHRSRRKRNEELAPLLRRGGDGRLRWHWDPALLDTIAHTGERHQGRLLEAARHVNVPVMLLAGGRSDVVSEATVAEFLRHVPHARYAAIPGATHMLAGDDNDAFTHEIEKFLSAIEPPVSARAGGNGEGDPQPRHSVGASP